MNPADDDIVRRLLERPLPPATGPCPDEGDLAAWAEDRADEDRRARVEDHLAVCDDCREVAFATRDVLGEAGHGTSPTVRVTAVPARPSARTGARRWVAAAVVLVAVGAGLATWLATRTAGLAPPGPAGTDARLLAVVRDLREGAPDALGDFRPLTPEERRGDAMEATRSGLKVREPAGTVGTVRPAFSWSVAMPTEATDVTVVAIDGTEIWRRTVGGDSLPYPPDAPALEPGRDYVVEIAARGAAHATTVSRKFRVASTEEISRRDRALAAVERAAPQDLADLLAAQVLARQGWWIEAEARAARHAKAAPDDPVGVETWTWISRRLGWPDPAPR